MTKHKKQHFIPQCYLKPWCTVPMSDKREPFVWIYSKDGQEVKRKAPKNVFYETDMYTIEREGQRNLVLEHGLNGLETEYSKLRSHKLERRRPLTESEHFLLCAFIAAMTARTPAWRSHHKEHWNETLKMMDSLNEQFSGMPPGRGHPLVEPGNSHQDNTLSYEDVRELANDPLKPMLTPSIRAMAPLYSKIDFAILETNSSIGFITSDNPCVAFDSEAYKRPPMYRSPALMYDTIEITMPLSPKQLVLLNRKGVNGYLPIPDKWVNEFNRRTRFHCHKAFIVKKKFKDDHWFYAGKKPDDAWEPP